MSDYFNPDSLQALVKDSNREQPLFLLPLHRLHRAGYLVYTSSSDPANLVPCLVVEHRYKLEENYKIELQPVLEGYSNDTFYLSDFAMLIRQGDVKILNQTQSWESQLPLVPDVSWTSRITNLGKELLSAISRDCRRLRFR